MTITDVGVKTRKGFIKGHIIDSGKGGFVIELINGVVIGAPNKYINTKSLGKSYLAGLERFKSVLVEGGE